MSKLDDSKLIFICGCPRSGTSWTWGLLSCLPNIQPLLIEDFPTIKTNSGLEKMKTPNGYTTTETTIFFSNLNDEEIKAGIVNKQLSSPDDYILEKTPSNALKLDRIINLFPNSRIIHVVRDPRSVVNSMLKSEFSNGHKIARDLNEAIHKYLTFFNAVEPYGNYENVLQVKYEDLHSHPLKEMEKIGAFCNMYTKKESIEYAVNKNSNKPQTTTSNDYRKGYIDSYKNELTLYNKLKIEKKLKKVFKRYGYDRSLLSYILSFK